MIKKGFTLMEALIVIAVLAIIGAIITPAVLRAIPNNNFHLFKKAYTTLSQVSGELVNDQIIYPDGDLFVQPCVPRDTQLQNQVGDCPCGSFADCVIKRLNILESSGSTFTTSDGMYWRITNSWGSGGPKSDEYCNEYNNIDVIANTAEDGVKEVKSFNSKVVMVDLNGEKNPPNACGKDRFYLGVCRNGKVSVVNVSCDAQDSGEGALSKADTYNLALEYLNRIKKQAD